MWHGHGNSVADVSPYRTDGEFNGDPEWDVSTRGHAVRLDGSGDYLEVPETERFNFTSGPFTLVCLFQRAVTGSRHTLLANRATFGYQLRVESNGEVRLAMVNTSPNQDSGIFVDDTDLHFVAVSLGDGTSDSQPADWVIDDQTTTSTGTDPAGSSNPFTIGAQPGGGDNFEGLIHLALAYDRKLSIGEMQRLQRDPFGMFRQTVRVPVSVGPTNLAPDDLRSEARLEQAALDTDLQPDDLRSETRLDQTSLFDLLEPDDLRSETLLQGITLQLEPDDLRSATLLDQTFPSLAPRDLRAETRLDSISLRRPVDSDAQDELDKATGVAVSHVLEIHYEQADVDKVLRLTTASDDLDVTVEGSEQIFTKTAANVLRIGTVEISSDMAAQGVELTLGGVDRSFISLVMADDVHFRGRLVKIWRVYLDPDTGTVSAIVPDSDNGWLFHINDRIEFEENWGGRGEPGTVTVTTRIVSRLAVLQQPTPVMTNMDSHNEMLERAGVLDVGEPRDEFFRRLPSIIGKRFRWGDNYPGA